MELGAVLGDKLGSKLGKELGWILEQNSVLDHH
jgi:hypothetical protein